jgi:hypothetical protein
LRAGCGDVGAKPGRRGYQNKQQHAAMAEFVEAFSAGE